MQTAEQILNVVLTAGGKLAVEIGEIEALIADGKLTVTDPALAALIADGKLAVADANLEALIADGKLAVADAAVAGAVGALPSAADIGSAVGSAVPVPPTAEAIGSAVAAPSAEAIGSAVGSAVPVPPTAEAIGTAVAAPSAAAIALAMLPTSYTAVASTVTSHVTETETEHAFGATSKTVYMRNDAASAISFSLDGKASYFSLAAGQDVSIDIATTTLWAKAVGIDLAFTLLVGV